MKSEPKSGCSSQALSHNKTTANNSAFPSFQLPTSQILQKAGCVSSQQQTEMAAVHR
jgi:hypothetical protein